MVGNPDFADLKETVSVNTAVVEGTVYVSVKGTHEAEANFMEPFNMFYNQGLGAVAQEQENSITGSLKSNIDFNDFKALLDNGERFVSALLKSAKLDINLSLNTEFATKLRDLAQTFEPELASEPPMVFF